MTGMFLNVLLFIVEIVAAELLFTFRLRKRKNFIIRIILFVLLSFTMVCFGLLPSNLLNNSFFASGLFFIIFVITILLLCFCYAESFINILFCGVASYTAQHFAFELSNFIITLIMWGKSPFLDLYSNNVINLANFNLESIFWLLIYALSYWLVYGLIYFILGRYIGRYKNLEIKNVSLLFLVTVGLLVDIVLNSLFIYYDLNRAIITSIIIYTYNCLCCLLLVVIQLHLIKNKELENDLDFTKKLNAQQKKNYEISKESIDLINMKCHDMRYQIRQIGKNKSISQDTINEIEKAVSLYDSTVKTGNDVLDTILTEKSLKCSSNDIQLICVADGKILNFMKDEDIYSLFGNALDNAIEATLKCHDIEKRIIDVELYSTGNLITINISNPNVEKIILKDGLPLTTKNDHNSHGYGMKSIRYIVEKYNGNLIIDCNNNIFVLSILLSINK